MEAFSVEADVPGGPHTASRARRLVQRELSGRVPDGVVKNVQLLITELVANGVRHGGAVTGSVLHMVLEVRPPALHVEVVNSDSPGGAVRLRTPDLEGGGGLGLHIVDEVASRWGVRDEPRGVVWFELDCPPEDLL